MSMSISSNYSKLSDQQQIHEFELPSNIPPKAKKILIGEGTEVNQVETTKIKRLYKAIKDKISQNNLSRRGYNPLLKK